MSDLWDAGTTGLHQAEDGSLIAGFETEAMARSAGSRLTRERGDAIGSFTIEPAPGPERWDGDGGPSIVVVDDGRHRFQMTIETAGAFGHGAHPTTRLALDLVLSSVEPHHQVLDVGTGTGVLAIAAAMAGARRVTAIDNDPVAVAVAGANAAGNGVGVVCRRETIGELLEEYGGFDVIVGNLLLPAHRELAPAVISALVPGGTVITAGYLTEQADQLEAVYVTAALSMNRAGPTVTDRTVSGDWSAHRFMVP